MTELEKIQYTKSFVDKLANGVNPLDDTQIAESDIVNNARISKCFSYVSEVLQQIIDNGGIVSAPAKKERKPRRKAYYLLPEQAERFQFSEEPITEYEIVNRIKSIGPREGVKRLPRKKLTYWLISLDLIEPIYVGSIKKMVPTPCGEQIGITVEERHGERGVYFVLLFNLEAQHFILDNIESILNFDNAKYREDHNLSNTGKLWSDEDNEIVVKSFEDGLSISEIATLVKRSEKAVAIRLSRNGIEAYATKENDIN